MSQQPQSLKKGSISIDAQNIMPVIKRWLYSDKDIFLRELVSNGVDAITKLKMLGEGQDQELQVTVTLDKEQGQIRISDNGIGMTADEVDQFINQVAFSSAEQFLKNYTGEDASGIIGHFGLGFYSAFMAADLVSIDSLSYQPDAKPVRWQSQDGIAYEMGEGTRQTRGTTITLHVMEEEAEFLESHTVRDTLEKYCGYMAVPVYFEDLADIKQRQEQLAKQKEEKAQQAKDEDQAGESAAEAASAKTEDSHEDEEEAIAPLLINDTQPLWLKAPKDCTEEEYKDTYRKLFNTFEEPLFWIHLNVDYPFNLKGILYFPRIKRDFAGQDGQIKLFNRQVFVADNIKEVIPEFLMVLKGVMDCPDLPLNVSRSFLQNDGYVRRLSQHIVKKVGDKLNELFSSQRENYQRYWDDIHPFVKFGCIQDRKFYDAVKGSLLLKTTQDSYLTMEEYQARNGGKAEKKVYYTTDKARQAASIAPFLQKDIDVVVMDSLIDINFMSFLEYSGGADLQFLRVDADIQGLEEDSEEGKHIILEDIQQAARDALSMPELTVRLEALSDWDIPAVLTEDEQLRRFKDMSRIYGDKQLMPERYTLVLNRQSSVVQAIADMPQDETQQMLLKQIFDLARLSSRPLEGEELQAFMKRSNQLVQRLAVADRLEVQKGSSEDNK